MQHPIRSQVEFQTSKPIWNSNSRHVPSENKLFNLRCAARWLAGLEIKLSRTDTTLRSKPEAPRRVLLSYLRRFNIGTSRLFGGVYGIKFEFFWSRKVLEEVIA